MVPEGRIFAGFLHNYRLRTRISMTPSEQPGPDKEDANGPESDGRVARRGFFLISGAKLWFLVCSALLNLSLPRIFGGPVLYGEYAVVNTFISILNMVMVTGALQGVSKRVSERPEFARAVRARALSIQSWLGGAVFVALITGATAIATYLFQDPELASYVRIAAIVTLSYAWYAAMVGVLNGLKLFGTQALFDVIFATLKCSLMVILVLAGLGVAGAFWGFALAAVLVMVGSVVVTGRLTRGGETPSEPPRLFGFMIQVMGYVLFINVLLQIDVVVIKGAALSGVEQLLAHGGAELPWVKQLMTTTLAAGEPLTATQVTSALAGIFRATKVVSLLPYQAVIAITFVAFPLISRATFSEDAEGTRETVRAALRAAAILVALLATGVGAGGVDLLVTLFGSSYGLASVALAPLLFAMGLFALLYVLLSVLTAAGRPGDALWLSGLAALAHVGVLYGVVSTAEPGPDLLELASWAVLGVTAMTMYLATVVLNRRCGVRFPWMAMVRVMSACAVSAALVMAMGGEGLVLAAARMIVAGLAYGCMLLVTREVKGEDLRLILSALKLRRG